jgi:hypothetical protein
MAPAFSSRRQAVAFAILLATLLALPALLARPRWLRAHDVYSTIPVKYGPFAWIRKNIYADATDVDMAFLGSSHIWCDIDASYVQKSLSEHLGRRAEVFTLGWPWAGFDALYVVARDLLDHRHVHTLVIYDESSTENVPQLNSSRWFRVGESADALRGLPLSGRLGLYGGGVLGTPRRLLSVLRPDLLENPDRDRTDFWTTYYRAAPLAERRGSLRAGLAYGFSPYFVAHVPPVQASPSDALQYGNETRALFQFSGPPLAPYQLYFAQKLGQLCRDRGTQLVVLHTPSLGERERPVVIERLAWPDVLGRSVNLIGIPPSRMFAGMSARDATALFYEDGHLNQNGQDVFTPLITPLLMKLNARPNH